MKKYGGARTTHPVRARLAYDELLAHQLVLALVRRARKKQQGRAYQSGDELQARLRSLLLRSPARRKVR